MASACVVPTANAGGAEVVHDWTVLRWTTARCTPRRSCFAEGVVADADGVATFEGNWPVREEPVSGCHPGERHTCTDDQVSGSPWQL